MYTLMYIPCVALAQLSLLLPSPPPPPLPPPPSPSPPLPPPPKQSESSKENFQTVNGSWQVMAYVNVAEWKTNQVCEWLKGLDNSILPYVHSFMNHNVNGQQLLKLRPEDLEQLGVFKLGHQEIILEAVEYLRNFHYELDRENLQLLAMRLSCQTHSLHNELSRQTDSKPVSTQTLSDVVAIITTVKPLVRWLDRPPFSGQLDYNDKKAELLKLSLEMATCAQRDRFAEKPIEEIRTTCGQMAKLADYIIQDVADPMILQPSSLDLATLKKRPGDDLGFCILPSFHGAHQIAEIKFGSAAHQCGKMEEGDEIVQVNYQTIVGWERKSVLELFRESPTEILLTLKRRPRHTKVYGQIYIKPYRLPSNKKTPYATRWQNNLPSPRPELLTIPDFTMPLPRNVPKVSTPEPISIIDTVSMLDTMTTDDSSDSDSEIEPPSSVRLYSAKPRNLVQRRATITGASPTIKHSVNIEQFWKELKQEHSTSFQLRDKAASCTHGLDIVQAIPAPSLRPQTCLGIEHHSNKKGSITNDSRKVQFQDNFRDRLAYVSRSTYNSREQFTPNYIISPEMPNSGNNIHMQTSDIAFIGIESNNKKSDNTTVPLKEIEYEDNRFSFINDNKKPITIEVKGYNNNECSKFEKSYNASAHDLTKSDDNLTEKKFEAGLDQQYKQQKVKNTSLMNNNSNTLNMTDFHLFENFEEYEKIQMPNFTTDNHEFVTDKSKIIGNVARKIIDIEKNIHNKSTESSLEKISSKFSSVCDPTKTNTDVKINGTDVNDNLDEFEADSGNITTDFDTDEENNCLEKNSIDIKSIYKPINSIERLNNNLMESSRESSEDKSESTNSYIESGTISCSSDGEITIKQFSDIIETIDNALQEQKKLNDDNSEYKKNENYNDKIFTEVISEKYNDMPNSHNDNEKMIEAPSSNIPLHKNAVVGTINMKYPTTSISNDIMYNNQSDASKKNTIVKPEVKPRLTPPEPPPRKYFAKPNSLNFNVNQQQQIINNNTRDHCQQQQPDKPKIPERTNVRRDIKKIDIIQETSPREEKNLSEHRRKSDRFETYSDFIEQSTDFIDEPITSMHELKNLTSIIDPYGYTQISETSSKEESNAQISVCLQPQDSPDSSCQSFQLQWNNKPRTLDKDRTHEKGVVNRAMMVARSMGLHSTSAKLSNSPKSTRKRNTILIKRRNVGVKDIVPGDLEGWLTYRSRGAGGAWTRAWFIMKGASFYRFKTQDSNKADCLIALSGFTASQATEVKSRKHAFKVYYTGTVFYFAADTEDTLAIWLEAINRATLGAERTGGLFSETDESDSENKTKIKSSTESKLLTEKTFGSLKKLGKRDSTVKDHEMSGASLDRKYLKFLGARTQNVPVPTAQFRSYRRVLPTSTPNRKPEKMSSPDLQVTVAGSTFYGLNASHSATDVLNSSHDMDDYRRTHDSISQNNGIIYGSSRNGDSTLPPAPPPPNPTRNDVYSSTRSFNNEVNTSNDKNELKIKIHKKSWETSCLHIKKSSANNYDRHKLYASSSDNKDFMHNETNTENDDHIRFSTLDYGERLKPQLWLRTIDRNNTNIELQHDTKRILRNDGHSCSSGDLTCHMCSETIHPKKGSSIVRNGSFNVSDQHRRNYIHSEHNWIDSLRSSDKRNFNAPKGRLKHVTQYHPPPMPMSSFDQDGMKAAFEMHLDKGIEQKKNCKSLRHLFGNKGPQKPNSLDLPYEQQKTLLGSPRLHRALFRDKSSHQRQNSCSRSAGDNGINQSLNSNNGANQCQTLNQSFNSNLTNDWNTDAQSHTPKCMVAGITLCQKRLNIRHPISPPTFPYIPPPTSPPPDYPGLEYPPVFEPGTYSLSDASLLRNRNTKNQNFED